jgi:hypothetical protein
MPLITVFTVKSGAETPSTKADHPLACCSTNTATAGLSLVQRADRCVVA